MRSLPRRERNQVLLSTALIGIGVMAAVDEIVFHQVLAWHHFINRSTSDVGLFSDGLLHAAELIAVVAGFFLLLDVRDRNVSAPIFGWAGFFLGAGGFQVFDGLVNHKLLRLHQIRYEVDILSYDLAWNAAGVGMIVVGIGLLRQAKETSSDEETR